MLKRPRDSVRKVLAHQRILALSAVGVIAGEASIFAQVLPRAAAVFTSAAGFPEPGGPYSLAHPTPPASRPRLIGRSHHLMPGNDRQLPGRQIALDHMQIGA